jgi:hypothetical protein
MDSTLKERNRPRFGPKDAPGRQMEIFEILHNFETEKFSRGICEWGCDRLANLTGEAILYENSDSLTEFVNARACETLLEAVRRHSMSSQIVASAACAAVSHLSYFAPKIQ